jgi:hypothetical protein
MNTWVLILFVHAGMLSDKDSMSLTNVPGFATEAVCQAAGKQAEALAKRTTKEVKFVCVKQGN